VQCNAKTSSCTANKQDKSIPELFLLFSCSRAALPAHDYLVHHAQTVFFNTIIQYMHMPHQKWFIGQA